jgi:GTP-binding protein Era
MKVLPHGTPQYPEGQMTNVTTEFWLAEIIREKIFMFTHEEVPYATEVRIQRMEKVINASGNPVLEVDALIVVNDERYKGMLIGAGGRKVKAIKACARKELQVATDKRVKLTLEVATDTHWMDRMDE